jgi:hypothetical protein
VYNAETSGLRVDGSANLYFYEGIDRYDFFAIDIDTGNAGTIRPGDDMYLRFALTANQDIKSIVYYPGDFLAVYDHKLLWRANLYIDERVNHETGAIIPGAVDWNNANPLIGDAWVANGNGGQISINSWTRFDDSTGAGAILNDGFDNQPAYGAVAYSWGGSDSPENFNADMQDQLSCLRQNNPNWAFTTSPDGLWSGYRFGTPNNDANHTYAPISAQLKPYTPGFRTWREYICGDDQGIYTRYSAGDDCTGFIQRVASYQGNIYLLNDLAEHRLEWEGTWNPAVDPDYTNTAGGAIGTTYTWPIDDWNLAVPGDVCIMTDHATIILKIVYTGTTRTTTKANIYFIEVAYAGGRYMAVNYQTWSPGPYNGTGQIKRLITNQ